MCTGTRYLSKIDLSKEETGGRDANPPDLANHLNVDVGRYFGKKILGYNWVATLR